MGATAFAAEAAVRAQRGGATNSPCDSVPGHFRGRRVSQRETGFQGVSPRELQEAQGSAGGRGGATPNRGWQADCSRSHLRRYRVTRNLP